MNMNDEDVLIEFLKMPLGSSNEVFNKFLKIPNVIFRGAGTERFLFVEGKRKDKVLLVAHADTVWDTRYGKFVASSQQDLSVDSSIWNRCGGLGADDRAGCAMIWLMKDLGHSILIVDGEEYGMKGSNFLMRENKDIAEKINKNHQFAIQLDRRNGRDFKCYGVGTNQFRNYVEQITGYQEPNRQSYTDICVLCQEVTGVNLSIGYHNEHTLSEYLVLAEWKHTLEICRMWLTMFELPKFEQDRSEKWLKKFNLLCK